MSPALQMSRWFSFVLLGVIDLLSGRALNGAPTDRRFRALWIPFAIIIAGAVAMTVYCTVRGYSGWEWKWTWRGVRARCV